MKREILLASENPLRSSIERIYSLFSVKMQRLLEDKIRVCFAGTLIVAFAVRIYGINFGLPYLYHPDEPVLVDTAIRMLRERSLNPHRFDWPSFYFYIQGFFFAVLFLVNKLIGFIKNQEVHWETISTWQIYLLGRTITTLVGTATVGLVYKVAKELINKETGIYASLILAFSFLHIENSKYITTDVAVTLLILLSFYFAVLIYLKGSFIFYVLAGLFAGLAGATKYNGAIILVAVIVAHLLRSIEKKEKILTPNIGYLFFFGIIGFLAGCPYSILDFRTFKKDFLWQIQHYSTGHYGAEGEHNWLYFLSYLFTKGFGSTLFVPAIGGFFYSISQIYRRQKTDILLLSFPLLYFLVVSSAKVNFVRNLLPLAPFIAVYGGIALAELRSRLKYFLGKPVLAIGLVMLLFVPSIRASLKYDYLISQKDTRTIALEWVERNIPKSSRIAVEGYSPPVSEKDFKVTRLWMLIEHSGEWYSSFDYVIASSYMFGRFYKDPKRYKFQVRKYKEIFNSLKMIKEFEPNNIDRPGPIVKVFRVTR